MWKVDKSFIFKANFGEIYVQLFSSTCSIFLLNIFNVCHSQCWNWNHEMLVNSKRWKMNHVYASWSLALICSCHRFWQADDVPSRPPLLSTSMIGEYHRSFTCSMIAHLICSLLASTATPWSAPAWEQMVWQSNVAGGPRRRQHEIRRGGGRDSAASNNVGEKEEMVG